MKYNSAKYIYMDISKVIPNIKKKNLNCGEIYENSLINFRKYEYFFEYIYILNIFLNIFFINQTC